MEADLIHRIRDTVMGVPARGPSYPVTTPEQAAQPGPDRLHPEDPKAVWQCLPTRVTCPVSVTASSAGVQTSAVFLHLREAQQMSPFILRAIFVSSTHLSSLDFLIKNAASGPIWYSQEGAVCKSFFFVLFSPLPSSASPLLCFPSDLSLPPLFPLSFYFFLHHYWVEDPCVPESLPIKFPHWCKTEASECVNLLSWVNSPVPSGFLHMAFSSTGTKQGCNA